MSQPKTFVRSLFRGQIDADALFPFPRPDAEALEMAEDIAGMVHDWAADAINPECIDEEKRIPAEVIDGMKELGLFGLTIAEPYGGAGQGQYAYARMMEAVANRCASTVTVLGAHLGIGVKGLMLFGTDEQKERWLPRCASGELTGAFLLTEAEAGSDAGSLAMTADLVDGEWHLQGRKTWITCGATAGLFTVFARTPAADGGKRPISAFVIPADTPGVVPGSPEDKMGLRGSNTVEVAFDDVRVPADHLLGPEGKGFKVALEILNSGRHGLAACCIGQAKLARDHALAHARERVQFGRPIGQFGMVQEMLAGMEADIYAMESATWMTACLMDAGTHETMLEAACCKMFATEALWRVANDALQVTGGTGFIREYPYERILRDARINMIFEGTNQVLRLMLATQGLRNLDRAGGGGSLDGLHPSFEAEAKQLEDATSALGLDALATLTTYGEGVRDAQLPLRRLSDQATAIFVATASLGRASEALTAGADGAEREARVARLVASRLQVDIARTRASANRETDALIAEVADEMS